MVLLTTKLILLKLDGKLGLIDINPWIDLTSVEKLLQFRHLLQDIILYL